MNTVVDSAISPAENKFMSEDNVKSVGSIIRRIEEPGHIDAGMHHGSDQPNVVGRCFFGQLTDKVYLSSHSGHSSLF
jgi:hypothetical protein